MIVSGLFYILAGVIDLFSFLLPSWHLPASLTGAYSHFAGYVYQWSNYFPIEATINCVLIIAGFHLFLMIARLASGFISIVRGGGSISTN